MPDSRILLGAILPILLVVGTGVDLRPEAATPLVASRPLLSAPTSSSALIPPTPLDDGVTAFVGVDVLPMDEERILRDHTVVVRQGRIVEVAPRSQVQPPAGATLVEGAGRFLMPGLAEMHGHTPGGEMEEPVMFLYVANGITTVRGMLGNQSHLDLRRRANTGELLAPTLYLAGPSFSGGTIQSAPQADQRAREQATAGWDLIKVHPGLTREQYDAMAMAAHQAGIRFAGHVPSDVGLRHAIEMGQETFDHLDGYIEFLDAFQGPVDRARLDEAVRMTREAGAWVVPTMVLWEVGIIGLGDAAEMAAWPEMRYWPRENLPMVTEGVEGWAGRQRNAARGAAENPARARQWAENRNTVLKALADGGAGVLMGTDSPQIFSVPGFSLHRELQAMAEAGMTPWQILVSGTRNVGEYFQGKDTFGTVAVGRRADLLLLNRNPLDDVAHVADRAGVMVRGRWLPEAEIQAGLQELAERFGN
jgi:imidazolonepropionase-like amidohydrolase